MEPGKLAGCQVLVSRHGHVAYQRNFGTLVVGGDRPVTDDSIWRIYSMTKPITSVALMSLYEHGLFKLTDPVHRYLPEWRDQRVGVVNDDGTPRSSSSPSARCRCATCSRTPPVSRTAGIRVIPSTSSTAKPASAATTSTSKASSSCSATCRSSSTPAPRGTTRSRPTCAGDSWKSSATSRSTTFLQEHIFDPLGMVDTGFTVPDESLDRFTANHARQPDKSLVVTDDPYDSIYGKPRAFLSGGGGLRVDDGRLRALLRDAAARRRARRPAGARPARRCAS